jgi:hypothetical protein
MAMANLAYVYDRMNRLDDAERSGREAVDELRRTYGPEHPVTLDAVVTLANIHRRQKRYGDAGGIEKLCSRGPPRRIAGRVSAEHPDTLVAMTSRGRFYSDSAASVEAELLLL